MKINLDLSKMGQTALKFTKDNPILVIGTAVVGYIVIRDHFLIKRIDKNTRTDK